MNLEPVTLISAIASVLGLIISIYLLYKVGKLAKAKKEEREFMKRILKIEELDYMLTYLTEILSDDKVTEEEMKKLIPTLSELRGKFIGALETIGEVYQEEIIRYPIFPTGYYTESFFLEKLKDAKKLIRVVCYRNIRIASYGVLELLANKIRQKCKVEILFISPQAPNYVLEHIASKLPPPHQSIEEMRDELKKNLKQIIAVIKEKVGDDNKMRNYFECRTYNDVPRFHMVQIDNKIYLGLTNYRSGLVKYKKEELRPYLIIPENSPVGKYIIANYKYLYETYSKRCNENDEN